MILIQCICAESVSAGSFDARDAFILITGLNAPFDCYLRPRTCKNNLIKLHNNSYGPYVHIFNTCILVIHMAIHILAIHMDRTYVFSTRAYWCSSSAHLQVVCQQDHSTPVVHSQAHHRVECSPWLLTASTYEQPRRNACVLRELNLFRRLLDRNKCIHEAATNHS